MRAHTGGVFLRVVGLFVLERESEKTYEKGVEVFSKSQQRSQITSVRLTERRGPFLKEAY